MFCRFLRHRYRVIRKPYPLLRIIIGVCIPSEYFLVTGSDTCIPDIVARTCATGIVVSLPCGLHGRRLNSAGFRGNPRQSGRIGFIVIPKLHNGVAGPGSL